MCKPRVAQYDGTVVLRVADHSADCLVHCAEGLLLVPFIPGQRRGREVDRVSARTVEKLNLLYDLACVLVLQLESSLLALGHM